MNIVWAKRFSAKSLDLSLIGLIINMYDYYFHRYPSKFYTMFIVYVVYETILTVSQRNTFGKFLFKIKIIDEAKKEITIFKAVTRSFFSLISIYTLGLGIIYARFNEKSLTAHERLTNTRVIDLDI